ncbi:MAG: hypothetical protein ACXAE3_13600 [Candidatus Kariarchaeaceae archaeon]
MSPISSLDDEWVDLFQDSVHGSTYLAIQFIQLLMKTPMGARSHYISQMRKMYADMAIIRRIPDELEEHTDVHLQVLLDELLSQNDRIRTNLTQAFEPHTRILTVSHSGLLAGILALIPKSYLCWRSPPGNEGELLAEEIDGEVIDDWMELMDEGNVDCVVMGCDTYAEFSFVNKVGSQKLISYAERSNIPVFVVTSTWKHVEAIKPIRSELLELVDFSDGVTLLTEKG